ncbi:MAG TPA: Rrf2 family transcriptional regulator [Planctomycetaceae bacterium]|nr:Rrf2 family transcriptional regulator [Planctomycetaceae bacterium]
MKLSRTVAYAVQASLHLAESRDDRPVPCSQLASAGKMPERFLLQILRHLVARGILSSSRGIDGGYRLDRPPEDISLLEVIEAIDGPMVTTVPLGDGLSDGAKNRLHAAINDVTEHSRRHLASIKLTHLLPKRKTRN